jgi:MtN3 and saliva related transmembrane protein
MVETSEYFGYLGMVFLTLTLIPQLLRVFKTKKAEDLSYIFLSVNILTCVFFLIYGILLEETPLIIANTIVILQTLTLIFLKNKYHNNTVGING